MHGKDLLYLWNLMESVPHAIYLATFLYACFGRFQGVTVPLLDHCPFANPRLFFFIILNKHNG